MYLECLANGGLVNLSCPEASAEVVWLPQARLEHSPCSPSRLC